MRKLIFLFISLFLLYSHTFAASDYQSDYTLIDCENWSDSSWIPFDSTKPYKTLNDWIEKTIEYINNNINNWLLTYQVGINFNIKVSCSLQKLWVNTINLNFDWNAYKNYLNIEWIWDNGLVISNIIFNIPYLKWWGIIFNNAKFLSNSVWYYFLTNPPYLWYDYYNLWVKIKDSYIKLLPWTEFWNTNSYWYNDYAHWVTYVVKYYYNPFQYIQNSTIDIEMNWNYNFYTPLIIKDSKINFQNLYSSWTYNITFQNKWWNFWWYDLNFFTLMSNELDLWWNNFITENTKNVSFINNKFSNFNNFYLWANDTNLKYWIFVNNLFENTNTIDISYNRNIINNVFLGEYTDTYDIRNLRKNYKLDNIWTKWIWWIFQKLNASDMFKLNYSSTSLYKEITWQDIPAIANSVYAIFSR